MKVLVSSLTQAAANRLKTPVIGSFILSWIAINHKILFTLILSENKERITLLNGLKFEWISDIVLPIIVTLIYIFLVPAIQWLIDVVKFKFIDKKRTESQHSQLKSKYESLAEVSEQQSKSSLEYHNQRNLKDLEKWDSERTTLLGDITRLNTDCQHEKELRQESDLSLSKAKLKIDNLEVDINEYKSKLPKMQELNSVLNELSNKLESKINKASKRLDKEEVTSPSMTDEDRSILNFRRALKEDDLEELKSMMDNILHMKNSIDRIVDAEEKYKVSDTGNTQLNVNYPLVA